MIRSRAFVLAAALGSAFAPTAMAARFCLQNQSLPPQCIYDDATECTREANRQGGSCTVNQAQVALPNGIGQYCVVLSAGVASCSYGDRDTCTQAASRQGGICAVSARVAPYKAPDPESRINGR
jgi:hypothetical protein